MTDKKKSTADKVKELQVKLQADLKSGKISKSDFESRRWNSKQLIADFEEQAINGIWITEYTNYAEFGNNYVNKPVGTESKKDVLRALLQSAGLQVNNDAGLIVVFESTEGQVNK